MNGEAIGGLIISLLAFGAVISVIRYFRERNSCPRCGDPSRPLVILKHNQHVSDGKWKRIDSKWGDVVKCKACGHEWRRMPLDNGGGNGGFGGGSAG